MERLGRLHEHFEQQLVEAENRNTVMVGKVYTVVSAKLATLFKPVTPLVACL